MVARSLLSLLLFVVLTLPAGFAVAQDVPEVDPVVPAEPVEPGEPGEGDLAEQILGKWMLKSVEADGEIEELEDGEFVAEFLADGSMKTFEGGEPADSGRYTIVGNVLTVYVGDDTDGESSTLSIEGDTMKVKQELAPGVEMTVTFIRVAGE